MRKVVFIVFMCLAFMGQAYAQRYLPGQKGIQVTTSFVDGFKLSKGDGQAFSVGLALSTYTRNGNRWVFGGEYLEKRLDYKETLIPLTQITGEAGHYFNFLSDRKKIIFFSVGISALAGYETINWGKQQLSDGAIIDCEDNFLYGGAVSLEVELFLSDRIVLLMNARERLLMGSDISKFHTQLGIGLKYIIN